MIVMLYGEKRVGKDEVAKIFQEKGFTRLAFADKPKEMVCGMLNIPLKWFEKYKSMYRDKLIYFAEEMKKIDKNIWANAVLTQIEDNKNYVISDLRFLVEYEFFKNEDIKIIHIKDKNIKETDIDKILFDYEIDNSIKDKSVLKGKVEEIYKKIVKNS